MELKLQRIHYDETYTIGKLFIDGVFFSHTLEDKVRDINHDGDLNDPGEQKIKHYTAIPCGTYDVEITYSNRFKRKMPLLMNVPGFEGIRIHPGNDSDDTSGCILVGKNTVKGGLTNSRETYDKLFNILVYELQFEDVYMIIQDK